MVKAKNKLVLSIFPGIGLLDAGFENAGFCVVRGPDLLWGGDVHNFHAPRSVFSGVIGGPPCQAHVRYAALNKSIGNSVGKDLIPEFVRIVRESDADWFLMENSSLAPDIQIDGYKTQSLILHAALFGVEQNRKRKFQFGSKEGQTIKPNVLATLPERIEKTCLASEGASGVISNSRRETGEQKSYYAPRRPWSRFCQLQGLGSDFLKDAPFTQAGKYLVVGNGVPLPMANAIASSIRCLYGNK